MAKQIRIGFDPRGVLLPLACILPLKQLRPSSKSSHKFQQVLSSIREVGVIEPLIVYPQDAKAEMFILLDGHLRLEAVKQLGQTHVRCLIATDDEAYTYNKRVNRIATIQEHVMILGAIRNGVSEDRIARVLSVNVGAIRQRRDLLDGICKEAAEILKNKHLAPKLFGVLKKMKPVRQLEVTELMGAVSNFSVPYAKALLAATRSEMLIDPEKHKPVAGLSPEQVAKMEREMEVLQRDLKVIEDSHGNQVLNLVLARGYLAKLFGNARVVRYLGQKHVDIFRELQKITDSSSLES
jgi:hypothetical protein